MQVASCLQSTWNIRDSSTWASTTAIPLEKIDFQRLCASSLPAYLEAGGGSSLGEDSHATLDTPGENSYESVASPVPFGGLPPSGRLPTGPRPATSPCVRARTAASLTITSQSGDAETLQSLETLLGKYAFQLLYTDHAAGCRSSSSWILLRCHVDPDKTTSVAAWRRHSSVERTGECSVLTQPRTRMGAGKLTLLCCVQCGRAVCTGGAT